MSVQNLEANEIRQKVNAEFFFSIKALHFGFSLDQSVYWNTRSLNIKGGGLLPGWIKPPPNPPEPVQLLL
jgi:LytS/YehU family sensor histidine kinase